MGVVSSIATVKENLEDWGNKLMLLGYAQNDTGGTYHMLNIRTKRVVLSHDIIWLNKTYGEYAPKK